ncbi:MAG: T9SS type A sorting domain-containing protein [Bacteroidota bacterium]
MSESCQLQVYSLNGVLLKNIIVAKNISQLDVSDLENGIYFMKLQGQLTNSVYKLVIAK